MLRRCINIDSVDVLPNCFRASKRCIVKELDEVITAYRQAQQNQEKCLFATLVRVEGSSYRRVGARMLLTSSGGRAGSMSGGCLEGEIQKKAWWLTEKGPVVREYRTSGDDESGMPYGLGCNGTLHILLKRADAEDATRLNQLEKLRNQRTNAALATILNTPAVGRQRLYPGDDAGSDPLLKEEAVQSALKRVSASEVSEYLQFGETDIFVEAIRPRPRLVLCGAGDDARPVVQFARLLGWDVVVADGRAQLATPSRFPGATDVKCAPAGELPFTCKIRSDDAVVIMSHSFEQDRVLLGALLPMPLRYLGLLGPRHRTAQLIEGISMETPHLEGMARLHSPIGMDIGAHTSETIALAIIAEIQSVLSRLDAAADKGIKHSDASSVPA
jgi:xanthine dehydrogenase accessory factor